MFSEHPSCHIDIKLKKKLFSLWLKLLGFNLLTTFTYNLHQCYVVHCTSRTYLSHNWSSCLLTPHHTALPPKPLPLVITNLISFSLLLFVFWNIIVLQYHVSFCDTTQWFYISVYFKMITVSLVMICYHTNIHKYWLFSAHCTFCICDSFILQLEVCSA